MVVSPMVMYPRLLSTMCFKTAVSIALLVATFELLVGLYGQGELGFAASK